MPPGGTTGDDRGKAGAETDSYDRSGPSGPSTEITGADGVTGQEKKPEEPKKSRIKPPPEPIERVPKTIGRDCVGDREIAKGTTLYKTEDTGTIRVQIKAVGECKTMGLTLYGNDAGIGAGDGIGVTPWVGFLKVGKTYTIKWMDYENEKYGSSKVVTIQNIEDQIIHNR